MGKQSKLENLVFDKVAGAFVDYEHIDKLIPLRTAQDNRKEKYEIGSLAYFVPSLFEKAIPGIVIHREEENRIVTFVRIRTVDGDILEGNAAQFSARRPAQFKTKAATVKAAVSLNDLFRK